MYLCTAGLLLAACVTLSGCKPRTMGIAYSSTQASSADRSWLTAAQSCWPALAHSGLSDEALEHNLADPLHFRAAFGGYASLSDTEIESVVVHPVSAAPLPDHAALLRSATPVLTLSQAASGATPQSAPQGDLPEDALCAVHSGIPVGFN